MTFFIATNFSQETVISGLLTGGLLAQSRDHAMRFPEQGWRLVLNL
ncbi:hypothetical protein ACTMU2_25310 [Cupriavidus basilensis]